MQVLSDESAADSPLPPPAARNTSANSAHTTTKRGRTSTGMVLLLVALAGGGLVAGAALGTRAPVRYQADITVQVDQVLSFQPWEANLETARFAQAVLRGDLREQAATAAGIDAGDIGEIEATRQDSSPIVQVKLITDDADAAPAALTDLVDITLRAIVTSDSVPQQLIVDDLRPSLEDAWAERDAMWMQADVAPGTDLTATYNQARFDLETALAEQLVATEQWRLDQLPGLIARAEQTVATIEPMLQQWYDLTSTIDDIESRVSPAEDRLEVLGLGLDVLDTGGHRSEVTISEVSQTRSVARWAAGGAAIGIALALAVLALATLRPSRS